MLTTVTKLVLKWLTVPGAFSVSCSHTCTDGSLLRSLRCVPCDEPVL